MRGLGRLLEWLLLGVDALCAAGMALCAYSPAISPQTHPVLSCCGLAFPILLAVQLLFLLFWLLFGRRFLWLPVVALLCCGGAVWTTCPFPLYRSRPPRENIKFLSFNVMGFQTGQPHTADSPNATAEYLRQSKADIICLQECLAGPELPQRELDRLLEAYPYKHLYRIAGGFNALGCYSRYPILSARPIAYASRTNGSIAYTIRIGTDTVTVVNNHLESNRLTQDDKAVYAEMLREPDKEKVRAGSRRLLHKLAETVPVRAAQADSVARFIASQAGRPVIVCGDFNTSALSYTHRTIGRGLADAFSQSGCGPGISYHRNGFYFRIDHILVSSPLRSYRCTVDNSISTSDHYPIWCYIAPESRR